MAAAVAVNFIVVYGTKSENDYCVLVRFWSYLDQ